MVAPVGLSAPVAPSQNNDQTAVSDDRATISFRLGKAVVEGIDARRAYATAQQAFRTAFEKDGREALLKVLAPTGAPTAEQGTLVEAILTDGEKFIANWAMNTPFDVANVPKIKVEALATSKQAIVTAAQKNGVGDELLQGIGRVLEENPNIANDLSVAVRTAGTLDPLLKAAFHTWAVGLAGSDAVKATQLSASPNATVVQKTAAWSTVTFDALNAVSVAVQTSPALLSYVPTYVAPLVTEVTAPLPSALYMVGSALSTFLADHPHPIDDMRKIHLKDVTSALLSLAGAIDNTVSNALPTIVGIQP